MTLTTFDWVLACVVAISVVVGLFRGLIREVLSLLAWVLAAWITIVYAGAVAQRLQTVVESTELRLVLSFAGTFLVALVVISVIGWIIHRTLRMTGVSGGDRFLGGLFGLFRGGIIVAVVVMVVQLSPAAAQEPWLSGSVLVPWIQPAVDWLGNWLAAGLA
jgi:membrane protein required for colicin V production